MKSKRLLEENLNRQKKVQKFSAAQTEYLKKCQQEKRLVRCWQWIIMILFLAFWEFGARKGIINAFVFSSPSRVIRTILEMAEDGSLWYHTGITLLETFVSFFLILFLGTGMAVLLWWNTRLSQIFEPYLVMLNSLPKSALAPVFIVWLGANMKTIIVAAISVAVFGSVLTLYHSFAETEEDKLKLIITLGGKKKDILKKVILPGNIPTFLSLMKVNLGLSLVGVIIGEFLAARAGLGYLIIYASQVFKLDIVITSIFILCVISVLLYHGIARLEKNKRIIVYKICSRADTQRVDLSAGETVCKPVCGQFLPVVKDKMTRRNERFDIFFLTKRIH